MKKRSQARLSRRNEEKIRVFIMQHLESAMSLQTLADEVGLSRAHFCRAFRMTFGTTRSHYILERRIERACWLLSHTRHSLVNIAIECGMSDQAYFTNMFRRLRGNSPGRWRQQAGTVPRHIDPGI